MSNVANASIGAIDKIRSENSGLDSTLSDLNSTAYNAIIQLESECDGKIRAYSEMAQQAEELVSKAKANQARAQAEASAAASNAASTPKEIKETKTDSNGNTVTVTKPNPAYAAAQAAAKAAKANAAASGGVVADAESLCRYLKSQYANARQISGALSSLKNDLMRMVERALSAVHGADRSLQAAISAISDYMNYTLK